jgi:2-amino-4-hydroxy-6-hydroxymethyldihydropteridine diphosphokinase
MTLLPGIANVPSAETVFLGLGTNVGDRAGHLQEAVFSLATHPEIIVRAVSRVYETQYVGPGSQDPYLNACLEIRTGLEPTVLLAVLKGAEQRQGRRPDGHMLPRPIDLDILMFGRRVLDGTPLTVPHRQMRERAFVLEPLAELAGSEKFPDSGETIEAACAKIRRKSGPWIKVRLDVELAKALPNNNKEDWRAALAVHSR